MRPINSQIFRLVAVNAAFTMLFAAHLSAQSGGISAKALASRLDGGAATLFTAVPSSQTGIAFVNPIDTQHPLKRNFIAGFACGGVAIGDVNGDGVPDIYLTGTAAPSNRLYLQKAAWKFEDVTEQAKVAAAGEWSAGAAMADVNGDGRLDIYVCNYDRPNMLFINKTDPGGEVVFEESAKAYGLDVVDASLMASFCDYDCDGDLDVFIQCSEYQREGGRPAKPPVIKENGTYRVAEEFEKYYAVKPDERGVQTFVNAGRANHLFRNEGSGKKFTDVTDKAGIGERNISNSSTWWDYNQDGWMDLYVGNDFRDADQLYRNNGDGTFTDVIANTLAHTSWFSMGADAADINNDGLIDFLIADMAGTTHYVSKATMGEMGKFKEFMMTAVPRQFMRNALYVNTATPRFIEASFMAGLASTDWTWAVKFGDFDNDSLVDVFFSNGVARSFNDSDNARSVEDFVGQTAWDYWEKFPPRKETNLAFHNKGDLKFESAGKDWGLDHTGMSYASATGDLDGDGDLDLVVANLDEEVFLYRNNSTVGNSITVSLKGAAGNTNGIGAKVVISAGGNRMVRQLNPATGFLSSNDPALHFGLGKEKIVEALQVEWPSGHIQGFQNLRAGAHYVITEPATVAKKRKRNSPEWAFVRTRSLEGTRHVDTFYDDYERQPLLPWRHSNLGPGMAWGDVDGDGDQDCYLSAPKGQAGVLQLNDGKGNFSGKNVPAIAAHADREDLAPLFFDADGDGDLDLYVVSGSVECEPGNASLADRLYVNDGKGNFSDGSAALPDSRSSGSCAVAADYDRDGDLDVFVGGRVIPGAWPETPVSSLLRNDAGKFTDSAEASLSGVGLVTSAIWSDADGDGWVDLLVTCEWGSVRFFKNQSGTLVDQTTSSGLEKYRGWWNGIAAGDIDHDGDIDYVATNWGLNTQYKATDEKPELLFYGDLDGTGRKHIVEAKYEGSVCYPRRGLSCSSHAMPAIRQKLPTFNQFALADLRSVYSEDRLEKATRFEANYLQSSVLLNDGKGKFTVQPLPRFAQTSPGFGVVLTDFDSDGNLDCLIAQNFFSPQHETGNMDGGLSALLHGNGDGTFTPVWPTVSGLIVPADAKSLVAVDLDNNQVIDFVFGLNSNPAWAFVNRIQTKHLAVTLIGKGGNSQAIGARATFEEADLPSQTAEVYAGSGYLSQSPATLLFGMGGSGKEGTLSVRWPDGTASTYQVRTGRSTITVTQ
ncbi:MAG: VCBS repeat-containing protein [Verrucomicrobiae bacterium]|nr:VCBS repeat-containing protein [Verrucomicrobiae bacterium]